MNPTRLPTFVIGLGTLLTGVVMFEVLAFFFIVPTIDLVAIVNLVTSLPFIAIIILGGYWLTKSSIPQSRFHRLSWWTITGLIFFGGFFSIIAIFTIDQWLEQLGVIRWGVSIGAGTGLLVGIFEARAIENALTAERTKIRNEELIRQNKRLEDFANIITHDIRNPITVAKGYVELANETNEIGHLEKVDTALDRIEDIVEETLTLARSGQTIGDPSAISLEEVAHESWSHVPAEDATLQVQDLPTITGDADRLHHLFENLFRNAIEHGSSDVTIRVGPLTDGFYVEDTGPGIQPENRESVLEAGYSTAEDGTGFGLAIVTQIVQAHGWDLDITESDVGGARFEITNIDIAQAGPDASSPNPSAIS